MAFYTFIRVLGMMKKKCVSVGLSVVLILLCANCGGGGGGATGPANAPTLSTIQVTPQQANPNAIVIFYIDFVDVPGDLNGGEAWIRLQSQDGSYDETVMGMVSNAAGTSGTLTTSIELSPVIPRGTITCSIFVKDLAGNASNTVYTTLTVI